jgi:hypothetical protein
MPTLDDLTSTVTMSASELRLLEVRLVSKQHFRPLFFCPNCFCCTYVLHVNARAFVHFSFVPTRAFARFSFVPTAFNVRTSCQCLGFSCGRVQPFVWSFVSWKECVCALCILALENPSQSLQASKKAKRWGCPELYIHTVYDRVPVEFPAHNLVFIQYMRSICMVYTINTTLFSSLPITHAHLNTNTQTHTRLHAHERAHAHKCMHARACAHTHTYSHTYTLYTHTNTHTYTHTQDTRLVHKTLAWQDKVQHVYSNFIACPAFVAECSGGVAPPFEQFLWATACAESRAYGIEVRAAMW